MRNVQVVAGLLRREGEILLVEEKGPTETEPFWMLPGGVVEPGELLLRALQRELFEETGLEIHRPARLLYITQLETVSGSPLALLSRLSTTYVFEVASWAGEPGAADPDGFVLQVRFLPLSEALDLLARVPYRIMREPLLALLRGETDPGVMWFYEQEGDMEPRLLGTIGENRA